MGLLKKLFSEAEPTTAQEKVFFEQRFKLVFYYKNDCNSDEFDIIVTVGNHAYHIPSKQDLIRFVKLMRKEEYQNQYFIGYNTDYEEVSYEVIISELLVTFGARLYHMSLMDVVNYLKSNKVKLLNEELDFSSINYERLYVMFNNLVQNEKLYKLANLPSDTFNKASRILNEFYEERLIKK